MGLKKGSSEILADGNRIPGNFLGKGQIGKIYHRVRIFLENRWGNLKQGGKCIIASGGMDALAIRYKLQLVCKLKLGLVVSLLFPGYYGFALGTLSTHMVIYLWKKKRS